MDFYNIFGKIPETFRPFLVIFVARPRPNSDWVTQGQWVIAAFCVVKVQ